MLKKFTIAVAEKKKKKKKKKKKRRNVRSSRRAKFSTAAQKYVSTFKEA